MKQVEHLRREVGSILFGAMVRNSLGKRLQPLSPLQTSVAFDLFNI